MYGSLRTSVAELFLFEKLGQSCVDYDLHKRAYSEEILLVFAQGELIGVAR
jgi:hypothetical protein